MIILRLLILAILLPTISFGQLPPSYIRANEYDNMRLPLEDLKKIISSLQYYAKDIPIDSLELRKEPMLQLDFSRKEKALTLSTFNQIQELKINDVNFTDVNLRYYWENKPISEVNLYLNHYYKKLTVKGTDEKKVEALYRDIDNQLESKEVLFPWINWEIFFSVISFFLLAISGATFLQILVDRFYSAKTLSRRSIIFLFLSGIYIIFGFTFLLSSVRTRDIFPNFLLTTDSTTWIDRNTNLFGFIGLLIGIVPIFLKSIKWVLSRSK